MDTKTVQAEMNKLLAGIFGEENLRPEWRSNAHAKDWLYDENIYAPRPDIAVGPFNIEKGRNISGIEDAFYRHQDFFYRLEISNAHSNINPRCLIAIEIENSNKYKHMLGNIINASILGKIGIIVTLRDEFHDAAIKMRNYLQGAFEIKKMEHKPSNIEIKKYDELREILTQSQQ